MKRDEMTEALVESWTDAMELSDLIAFFRTAQEEYLEDMTEEEVRELYDNQFKVNRGLV